MRLHRFAFALGLLLLAQVFASGCIFIPSLEDRVVELVTTTTVSHEFTASGTNYSYSDTTTVVLDGGVESALDDAGISVDSLVSVKLSSLEYKVTSADVLPARTITNGRVEFTRLIPSATLKTLATGFTAAAGATTPWTAVALTPAGVTELNDALADVLKRLKNHSAAMPGPNYNLLSARVSGDATPASGTINFKYELRLTISITGRVVLKSIHG